MQPEVRDNIRFFDVHQVAGILNIDEQTVYKALRQGKLPAMRIGSLYRVSDEDLAQFFRRSRQKARDRITRRAAELADEGAAERE